MADISKIKLPNGNEYNLKDSVAQNKLDRLQVNASYDPEDEAIVLILGFERQKVTIANANITPQGLVATYSQWDLIAFSVTPGEVLTSITSSWSAGLLYGFFVNKPALNSVTYNNSRTSLSGITVANNVTVPDGCHWIGIRPNAGGTATVVPS